MTELFANANRAIDDCAQDREAAREALHDANRGAYEAGQASIVLGLVSGLITTVASSTTAATIDDTSHTVRDIGIGTTVTTSVLGAGGEIITAILVNPGAQRSAERRLESASEVWGRVETARADLTSAVVQHATARRRLARADTARNREAVDDAAERIAEKLEALYTAGTCSGGVPGPPVPGMSLMATEGDGELEVGPQLQDFLERLAPALSSDAILGLEQGTSSGGDVTVDDNPSEAPVPPLDRGEAEPGAPAPPSQP